MKHYISASGNSVTLQLTYYPYERYGGSGKKTVKISAPTVFDALVKMVDNLRLYFDSDDIEDDEMTEEDIISTIESQNGDGCDYITELKNLNTGEILLEGYDDFAEYEDEEW